MKREKWQVEVTDTFCGKPNYYWVRRHSLYLPEDSSARGVMQAARAAAGYTASRGITYWHGDAGEFRPYGASVIMFVTFAHWPEGDGKCEYHRPPTHSEIRFGHGATHYRDFTLAESCDADGKRKQVIRAADDVLFYSCR